MRWISGGHFTSKEKKQRECLSKLIQDKKQIKGRAGVKLQGHLILTSGFFQRKSCWSHRAPVKCRQPESRGAGSNPRNQGFSLSSEEPCITSPLPPHSRASYQYSPYRGTRVKQFFTHLGILDLVNSAIQSNIWDTSQLSRQAGKVNTHLLPHFTLPMNDFAFFKTLAIEMG